MSTRRRWICCVVGIVQLLAAGLFGWSAIFLHERLGPDFVAGAGAQLVESLKTEDAVFDDEDAIGNSIVEVLSEMHDQKLGPLVLWKNTLLINGLFFVVFGLWPSRKRVPAG